MKPCVFIFWIALFPFFSPGQDIDSLKQLNEAAVRANDRDNSAYYSAYIGYIYFQRKEYDLALPYFYEVLKQKNRISKKGPVASVMTGLGGIYFQRGFPDSSIYYYKQALAYFVTVQDTVEILSARSNLAIQYRDLGLYQEALETSFDAVAMLEKQKPGRILASFYNTIGSTYYKIGEYRKSREYYKRSLRLRQQLMLWKLVSQSYNNIAETYIRQNLYDSALENLNRSISLKRKEHDDFSLPEVMTNTGLVYLRTKNYVKAEQYLNEALILHEKNGDRVGQAVALNHLGEVFLDASKFDKAAIALNQSESLVRQTGSLEHLHENLLLKIKMHKARLEFSKAIVYAEELRAVADSLLARDKIRSMMSADVKYQSRKKDEQIGIITEREKLALAQLQARKAQVKALALGIISLVIITGLVLYNIRTVRRSKAKVELLLRELHHRVKNNLQMLSSILALQTHQLTDRKAVEAARSNETRVNAMALIHRKLYFKEDASAVSCGEYIQELVNYLVQTYGYSGKDIKLDIEVEPISLDVDKLVPIGLIINELLSNAFKHAFRDNQSPSLYVSLHSNENNGITVEVRDNGSGVPRFDDPSSQGFGLRMIKTLIRQLKGTVDISSEKGSRFVLNIPIMH